MRANQQDTVTPKASGNEADNRPLLPMIDYGLMGVDIIVDGKKVTDLQASDVQSDTEANLRRNQNREEQ